MLLKAEAEPAGRFLFLHPTPSHLHQQTWAPQQGNISWERGEILSRPPISELEGKQETPWQSFNTQGNEGCRDRKEK